MCWVTWMIWKTIKKENIKDMISFLNHRWPDSSGEFTWEDFVLWSTRLSVMDISDSWDMPFICDDWDFVLSYNWEITNYKELEKKYSLKEKYSFKSSWDTEVLIYLYKELWINKLLKEIDWYFAFSLFDKKLNKIYIVRDFFWTRPMFYLEQESNFYFASEIKALLQVEWFKKELDKEVIFHFFWLGYVPWEHTPFKWIKELDGGHFIEYDLDNKNYSIKEYHKLDAEINYNRSFKETKKELADIFEDSISRNFDSDASIWTTLSWWIDTSAIVAMLKKIWKNKNLHTFSIKVNESSFDESEYQKIMSEYANTIHHEVVINPSDIRDNIYKYISFTDEPYADGSAIPTYVLCKEAKKHVKVLLSWEWWDELFSAYETHHAYLYRKYYNKYVPKFLDKIISKIIHSLPVNLKKLSFDFKAKRFLKWSKYNIPESHYYWRHILSDKEQRSIIKTEDTYNKTSSFFSNIFNKLKEFKEDLSKLAYIDMKMFLIWDLMIKNDRMLMANSIEGRYPLLERKITDFAFSIPEKFKINLFKRRIIQKESIKDILPKKIYKRPNFWMEIPYSSWLINELKDLSDKYFSEDFIEKTWTLNYEIVNKLYSEHKDLKKDNWRFLWALLNFCIWYELYFLTDDYKKYI